MGCLFNKALLVGIMLMAVCAPSAAQSVLASGSIKLTAQSLTYIGNSSQVDIEGLEISQKQLHINADHATANALDFSHSQWHLHGNVQISTGTAQISSKQAELTIRNDRLATLKLQGDPATFKDASLGGGTAITGSAEKLYFDNIHHRLSLTGHAHLKMGANEFSGCKFIYDLEKQTFSSGSIQCDQPVRITVTPPADKPEKQDKPQ